MKAAMITTSMSRQAGGIHNALRALSSHLYEFGVETEVFAARDAASDEDRVTWDGTPVQILRRKGPLSFAYQPDLMRALEQATPDLSHLHGLWTYPSLASLRWSGRVRPRIISPHGMLDPWALRNSAWKKRLVWMLFESANLKGATCMHALCAPERDAIRQLAIDVPVGIVPNGVDLSIADGSIGEAPWAGKVPRGAKVLLHLGRIHPKKGLANLIAGMSLLGNAGNDWHLVIAGWDQGEHEVELQAQANEIGLAQRVHFVGPQFGPDQRATLATATAFVLPSLSEGLPMSVLEAWAFRLPVVMTSQCNLPEGFTAGAALKIGTEANEIAEGLRNLVEMSAADLADMGQRGRELVERQFSWTQVASDMTALYEWSIGGGQAPSFVEFAVRRRRSREKEGAYRET